MIKDQGKACPSAAQQAVILQRMPSVTLAKGCSRGLGLVEDNLLAKRLAQQAPIDECRPRHGVSAVALTGDPSETINEVVH